ncbi:hypothetical protein [Endozoicomonas sp. ALC066]|uniref:hypothetical protein n=1 Tax=Endozoicomonas sp. ALC066 TaxID=3403078 RepID=UPI003BB7CFA9
MGAYWGTEYLAVTPETGPDKACVVSVDRRPSPLQSGTTEQTFLPVPEELKGLNYKVFHSLPDAIQHVKTHILEETTTDILQLVQKMEIIKLHNEKIRFLKSRNYKRDIEVNKQALIEMQAELKALRTLRRKPISIDL